MFDIDLNKYRIIDLSAEVVPGIDKRRIEVRRKTIETDDTFMYEIDTMSHIGTHIEAPAHFFENGKDVTQIPLTSYLGRALVIDIDFDRPHQPITRDLLEKEIGGKIKDGDIIIFRNLGRRYKLSGKVEEKHYFTIEAAHWLAEKRIKMLGFDTSFSTGEDKEAKRKFHDILLGKDIVLIEVLENLNELRKNEVYFIALPLRIKSLDSSPVRAIAIEARE